MWRFRRANSPADHPAERKLAILKSMNAADLADIGLRPRDLPRVEREMASRY